MKKLFKKQDPRKILLLLVLLFIIILTLALFYFLSTDDRNDTENPPTEISEEIANENLSGDLESIPQNQISPKYFNPSNSQFFTIELIEDKFSLNINDSKFENVYYAEWLNSQTIIYLENIETNKTTIKKLNIDTKQANDLKTFDSERIGFSLFDNTSIIISTENEIGYIDINNNYKSLHKFLKPVLGIDESFLPNFIIDENRKSVTVEIPDEKYLETRKMLLLKINESGEIIQKTLIVDSDEE